MPMNAITDPNNVDLKVGDSINGYHLQRMEALSEIHSVFYELEHTATGAKHIHVSNNDAENTFSVAFKTVPQDSTGVAHILEHTALCGSTRFPVRDPFFSMLKRSLSTFMNAFTASDWTMYPFSTQNKKDFYNLMDVYLDAAFFPKLDELSFKQEGHRLEVDENSRKTGDDQGALAYKGVVYNEMKGAMSSPDQVMVRSILKSLYPDTTYYNNSGGDPVFIPSLSYNQLKHFHQRHYHPSNAFFYTYGNLSLQDHLARINENVLSRFDRIDPKTDVPSQPRWQAPHTISYPYPFDPNEDATKKFQVCVAWLMADIRDTFEVLTLTLLEQVLMGNAASPLRKALIDSGLGTALCDGSGFDSENRDTLFVAGLKNVEETSAAKIETIIMEVLQGLADKGIDKELVESAIHQIEFHRKEITNTPYPYGIKLLLSFSGSWMHGGDPLKILNFETNLERIRNEVVRGGFFEGKIREYFLDNSHRILMTLMPDSRMAQEEEKRVSDELTEIQERLSPEDLHKLKQDAAALRQLQETEEDISVLPTLEREDVPPTVTVVKVSDHDDKLTSTFYDQATSGIFYFAAAAGAGLIPKQLVPLLSFFCYALPKIGTAQHDYTVMARRIDAYTGGIGLSTNPRTRFDDNGTCLPFVSLAGKCLNRNIDSMFDIIKEITKDFDFSDHTRLKNLLREYRSAYEAMVIHNGHRLAISLASRDFSQARALNEIWSGVHQLKSIKQLTQNLSDNKLASIAQDLASIGERLFTRRNFEMAFIGESGSMELARQYAESISNGFQAESNGFDQPDIAVGGAPIREAWTTSTAVSFVALTLPTVRMEHADSAALSVISKLLRSMYLHREIREKGGAYGGFALYNPEDGMFSFASYRDPHVVTTLDVFTRAAEFIRSGHYNDEDVKEAILQVCSEIDKPDPPGPSARKAFYRKIVSLTDDLRLDFKRRLIALKRDQVVAVAERYFGELSEKYGVAVISNEEKIAEANQKLGDNPLDVHRI